MVGWVVYSKTKYGINYQINPMNTFNLTNYFGFECVDEGLNSPPEPTHHQKLPPLDSSNCNRSQVEVKGMKGSSLSLNKEKSNSKNCIDNG